MELILKYFSDFTQKQIKQYESLFELYKDWNEKINVISRKDIDSLYERHILHSLSIAAVFEFQPGSEILDLGTGGGFPGIPLAIFFPDVKFHLVDSIAKKLKVVDGIAAGVGLTNITTEHARVEDVGNRKFEFVVSRAVAPLKDLWKWSRPLIANKKPGDASLLKQGDESPNNQSRLSPGLICLKGGDLASEIQESNTRPKVIEIRNLFTEQFFEDKYILYITR